MNVDVKRRHVDQTADDDDVAAGECGIDHGAAGKRHGEFAGDDRLRHFRSAGDIDRIDIEAVLFENAGLFGDEERRLAGADGAVSDGDAFGLGASHRH